MGPLRYCPFTLRRLELNSLLHFLDRSSIYYFLSTPNISCGHQEKKRPRGRARKRTWRACQGWFRLAGQDTRPGLHDGGWLETTSEMPVSRGRVKRSTGRHHFGALQSWGEPGVESRRGAARGSVVSHGLEIYWYLKCGPMG
jgi:hypothetical protein